MRKNTNANFKFVMVILFIVAGALILGHCTKRAEAFSKKPPVVQPSPSPTPEPVEVIDAYAGRQLIFDIATKDVCASAEYGDPSKKDPRIKHNQGKAPPGYLKGLALTYVKLICEHDEDLIAKQVYEIATAPVGSPDRDALAHYGLKPATPTDRLNVTFALMIGSNARESSWRPCVGRDINAKASDVKGCLPPGSGSTCEAGLAQTSYNSVPKSGALKDLYDSYLEYPRGCFEKEYYGKTTCTEANWKNHGTDPKALAFQALSKSCPGYTVESGLIMFRTTRTHYGPLNQKKAEVYPACSAMFERIRQAVIKQPSLCYVL